MNLYYHSFQVYFSSIHSAFDENYFYLGEDPFPVQTIQILTKIIKFELPYLFVLFISYLLQSYIQQTTTEITTRTAMFPILYKRIESFTKKFDSSYELLSHSQSVSPIERKPSLSIPNLKLKRNIPW